MRLHQTTSIGRCRSASILAFSLIEMLMAACVMSIVFAALFTGISTSYHLMDDTRENLRATQIMVSRMEGLRLCAWSNSQLFNPVIVPLNYTDTFYPLGLNLSTNKGTIYTGTITISTNFVLNPPATYNNKLALVTISVAWTSSHGDAVNVHRRSMSTYVAEYGLQNYIYAH
jgi:type II secretory pathway pseudopilin PulG